VGNNIKYIKANILNTDKEYNKSVKAEIFNNYFLMIAENISCKITGSSKLLVVLNTHCLIYLKVFNLPFTNIVFCNTSTGEIEKNHSPLPLEKVMWV
jgi:hypothetical protein